jgi:hypothetical protein
MRAVFSCTNDSMYSFFIPITAWCWNKLGVRSVVFVPIWRSEHLDFALKSASKWMMFFSFDAPEHKQATYAQCSRLFAGALPSPDDEMLITGDVDMAVFKVPPAPQKTHDFTVFGSDLTPKGQYPICYVAGEKFVWEAYFKCYKGFQGCLDNLLGDIECENFRGNYWGKDQETLFDTLAIAKVEHINRARPGTQFAGNRVDRDDINWRSYVNDSLVDAHLWRPGYTDENFENILELLQMKYPNEDFQWLIDYKNEYIKLL